jgi:hypothetical protein
MKGVIKGVMSFSESGKAPERGAEAGHREGRGCRVVRADRVDPVLMARAERSAVGQVIAVHADDGTDRSGLAEGPIKRHVSSPIGAAI